MFESIGKFISEGFTTAANEIKKQLCEGFSGALSQFRESFNLGNPTEGSPSNASKGIENLRQSSSGAKKTGKNPPQGLPSMS